MERTIDEKVKSAAKRLQKILIDSRLESGHRYALVDANVPEESYFNILEKVKRIAEKSGLGYCASWDGDLEYNCRIQFLP